MSHLFEVSQCGMSRYHLENDRKFPSSSDNYCVIISCGGVVYWHTFCKVCRLSFLYPKRIRVHFGLCTFIDIICNEGGTGKMGKTFHLWIHRISGFSLSFALILSFLAVVGCSSGGGDGVFFFPQTTTVTVEAGDATLTCADEGDMVACRGIKYAEALRFAPSEMVELAGDINAQSFGNICIQDDGTGSEDCLFLNVFFPKGTQAYDDLPVMFWIHGGALIQGAGSVPGYDVPALVNEGVVVVTINYRLNAFGFLPHPALEDPTGNFGLKDQVKALEWVREYIADFGGDPQNVTIFGESA
ncbi:MAG TPA: carboxylesterase family protein, partial [Smithellaceae bacterium]|nr:carboxylesterase family protein [Smithellaceae bacterium]